MASSSARWAPAAALLALLGGTLGVAMDALHVASGTTSYAAPWILGIATWTIPLFATAGVALGLGPVLVDRTLASRGLLTIDAPPTGARAGVAMLAFVGAYATSCVLRGALAAVVLASIAALIWWIADHRPIGIAHAVGAAIVGPAVEIALVSGGAFTHHDTGLFGVAVWLPCLYLCASLATSALARRLVASEGGLTSGAAQATPSGRGDDSPLRPTRATTSRR